MALIECNECGAQVSDKSSKCPKCGNPLTPSATERAKTFFKTFFNSKLFIVICVLAGLAGIIAGLYLAPYFYHIIGLKWIEDAYIGIRWSDKEILTLCYLFIGLVLLCIAVTKIFPRLNKGFLAVIIIAIISSFGFLANKGKSELETELKTLQAEQKKKESDPEFKKSKAGADLLKQELKNCSNVKPINTDLTDYCNALKESAINIYKTPLNGLGAKDYHATYKNEYGNQVTDRIIVFFNDEKPIMFAKEHILMGARDSDILLLLFPDFE